MTELVLGSGVYLYDDELQPIRKSCFLKIGKPLDGKKMARKLLGIFFTRKQLKRGTLSTSPKSGLVRLDNRIIEAIICK